MSREANNIKKAKWKAYALAEMKTESNIKNTAIKTVVETGLSVLVGGAIGSFVGRPSFLVGLAATGLGHWFGISYLPPIGIGMMASSNVMGIDKQVGGFDLAGGTDRLKEFGNSLLHRTYLDKIFKKKSSANKEIEEGTSGFGDVEEQNLALSDIENQLARSAMNFQRQRGRRPIVTEEVQGTEEPDFSGM